jgi:hypothetical protein
MFISEFVLLAMFWYTLHSMPEVIHTVAYVFGLMLASWAFDRYFPAE